jgi:tRNA pseudouridine32 synthase/23S rRNA pseudouridine746 synthase
MGKSSLDSPQEFLWSFEKNVEELQLPEKFTFPFYYTPHELSVLASDQLKSYLDQQIDFEHNFGLKEGQEGLVIGKMFGVLIVRQADGQLKFLAAFSGKLANSNHHKRFVPPVFDMLEEGGYFKVEELEINAITKEIEQLEVNPLIDKAKAFLHAEQLLMEDRLEAQRHKARLAKAERKVWRKEAEQSLSGAELEDRLGKIKHESLCFKFYQKDLVHYWNLRVAMAKDALEKLLKPINLLKEERKQRSAALQAKLFSEYSFLNAHGKLKSLQSIFERTIFEIPPAGAGECAAPKLLHYAFKNNLEPICMAEFWWGASPKSEVRKHGNFYPACKGKCEPILSHMLLGLSVDENPMDNFESSDKELEFVYEDEHLLVVNKPADFLSVPGKTIVDSVYERIKKAYPKATGPLIVHRLDMATSGLMLLAKDKETHRLLQAQFIKRTVKKRYEALLNGLLEGEKGRIELPLRVDLEDRPRQLVCFEHGKHALTVWEKREEIEGKTKVYFYPITGRTHQLRVHASHAEGLNVPIVGDDLYGSSDSRLHLHAGFIQFEHPFSKRIMKFNIPASF